MYVKYLLKNPISYIHIYTMHTYICNIVSYVCIMVIDILFYLMVINIHIRQL